MSKELELTDEQYLRVLKKIEATIAQDDFKVGCSDCTIIGAKSTDSNCGFCNNEYTDEDMALFPDQFPERKSMKYRRKNHRCPFDERKEPRIIGWGYGCFCGCYLFKHLGKRDWNLALMREMVNHAIEVARGYVGEEEVKKMQCQCEAAQDGNCLAVLGIKHLGGMVEIKIEAPHIRKAQYGGALSVYLTNDDFISFFDTMSAKKSGYDDAKLECQEKEAHNKQLQQCVKELKEQLSKMEAECQAKVERFCDWMLEEVPYKNANDEGTMPRHLGISSDILKKAILDWWQNLKSENSGFVLRNVVGND